MHASGEIGSFGGFFEHTLGTDRHNGEKQNMATSTNNDKQMCNNDKNFGVLTTLLLLTH